MKLYKLIKTEVHVKPADNIWTYDCYVVVEQNAITGFIDDCWRYGWRIAVHNLRQTLV